MSKAFIETRVKITDCGFAEFYIPSGEARELLEMMKSRIRRLSHLAVNDPASFADITRLARLCFVIASSPEEGVGLKRLSHEDVESMYALPHDRKTEVVLECLNALRNGVRSAAMNPDVVDQAAKSVYEVMEG